MIKLYNTASRKLEVFNPIVKTRVGVYSCGPTVYWNQHIGHMYAYVHWDILVRFLLHSGYKVNWVMNVTDVGHLTSDEDAGEDKLEKGAKREGLTVWEIAEKYTEQFLNSLDLLNIRRPTTLCRATDHIKEQIELIGKLERNGFTYRTSTGVVFNTEKFAGYPDFAKLNLEEQKSGARVEVDVEKKNPWDFLLWVTNQPNHIMQWESPWGKGFPGWHIECTAMSTKYLGDLFDIHTGGKEHIPVHHTDEIAQAVGAFGYKSANYWLHNEWLTVKGEKMSKSLGNFYTVQDLIGKGYDPVALRLLFLGSHYRTGLNFSFEALDSAQKALQRLRKRVASLMEGDASFGCAEYDERFSSALGDDLNTAKAVSILWEITERDSLPDSSRLVSLKRFDDVLGLSLFKPTENEPIPDEVKELLLERDKARSARDFRKSDDVRKAIVSLGYSLEDSSSGTVVKKMQENKFDSK